MDEDITIERNYWAVIPAPVFNDEGLDSDEKLLYALISTLTHETGYCFASNAYFMKRLHVTDRTVQRRLRTLKDRGHIQIVNGEGGAGRRKIYAGINPLANNPDRNVGVTGNPDRIVGVTPTGLSPNPDRIVGDSNKVNNKTENPPKAPQGAAGGEKPKIWDEEAFEALWKLYPKKKDKAKAIKEWNRLKADRKLMREMSAALRAQMASEEWQRDNGRAVPYLCRWLSHRRWEDEQEVTLPPQKGQEVRRIWLN